MNDKSTQINPFNKPSITRRAQAVQRFLKSQREISQRLLEETEAGRCPHPSCPLQKGVHQ